MSALTFDAARALAVYADEPDVCIACGDEPTVLGLYHESRTGELAALAWCDKPECIEDRDHPSYLLKTIVKRVAV